MTCYDIVDISHYWSFSYSFIHILYLYIYNCIRWFNQVILGVSENGVLASNCWAHPAIWGRLPGHCHLWSLPFDGRQKARKLWPWGEVHQGVDELFFFDPRQLWWSQRNKDGQLRQRVGPYFGQQSDQLFNLDQFWRSWYRPVWAAHSSVMFRPHFLLINCRTMWVRHLATCNPGNAGPGQHSQQL